MLNRVAPPPTRGTLSTCPRLRVSFLPCKRFEPGYLANRGEINRENMAVRSEYFRSYHLPMLFAQQNDSQSEEINVIGESQAENRPVFVQEAEQEAEI